ncbi:MAG: SPOR domain-containing protein [Betaproteobacteria bacterium]|nr:SPOR domain-containing protein [Betaproteobacteria bacterium]
MSDFPASDADDLEIKKRARRRLVGATVLALLAVVVLPLAIRDGEAPRTVPDMQVSIPERDELELPPPVPEDDFESARVVIEPDAVSGEPGFPVEMPPSLPEPPSPPSASLPPEQRAPTPPVQSSGEHRPPPSRPGTIEKETEAARALALLNDSSPAKETETGGKAGKKVQGQVFVQVASFGKADRAAKQVQELKKQGFAAYAEKAGKVTRVRIGPLPRSEGEQAVARLKAQGHNAMLSLR